MLYITFTIWLLKKQEKDNLLREYIRRKQGLLIFSSLETKTHQGRKTNED